MIRLRATTNVLGFPGYEPPEHESATARIDRIGGHDLVVVEFDFGVLGGSMGLAAGETVCRAFERATERGLPVLAITRSGGARMQEGMFALAQMPATLQARDAFARTTGLPFIAYLRHPTTGGVFASFASTADVILAEPGATIGFAGPRVAEAFTGAPLPGGSHTAESALEHGLIDRLVEPAALTDALAELLPDAVAGGRLSVAPVLWSYTTPSAGAGDVDPWAAIQRARDPQRRRRLAEQFDLSAFGERMEMGPRGHARVLATRGEPLLPEDYRLVRDLLADLEATATSLVVLVDMPGADPSATSEADAIAREIAHTMRSMLTTSVPTLAIVTGEGGSGGALALCAGADRLLICRDAYFSVIAPELAATILRRTDVEQVARDLRCGPADLVRFGLADALVDDDELEVLIEDPSAPTRGWEATHGRDRWRAPGRALTASA
jgi:acetyl-CoA carboxylase carboxyl transferase subunit beta